LVFEPDEAFFLNLINATNATLADAQGQATIVNDDPLPIVSIGPAFRTEGSSGTSNTTFTASLSNATYQPVTVNYATADGTATAGNDYVTAAGAITFNPGEVSKTFGVPIIGDTLDEIDETFTVSLSNAANATLGTAQAVVTILDDDGPTISLNDINVTENDSGTRNATFTLLLSAASPQGVSVSFSTFDGTATAFSDYVRAFDRFAGVPAGQTSATFNVQVIGDLRIEADETFTVRLATPSGGTIADGEGVCTIVNDDAPGSFQFGAAAYSVNESGSAVVTVSRTGGRSGVVTVDYSTNDGTANAGADYTASSGTLTFNEGEASKTFAVPITEDSSDEEDETVNLILSGPTGGAALGTQNTAVLRIIDDDATRVRFSDATYTAAEDAGRVVVTVTRGGDTSATTTVEYATLDDPSAVRCDDTATMPGVAFARCDYATTIDTLTFAPGERQKTFIVPLIDDAHVENNETVQLKLSNPIGGVLDTQNTALLVITNNDAPGAPNPIFSSEFFVRMQYLDFLSREPDQGGFDAWLGVLNRCSNVNDNPDCDRNHVSSSFFRSREFQLKGYFVFLFYKAAFNRRPEYVEIISDMRAMTGQTTEELNQKRAAFADAFVRRTEFAALRGLPPQAYVEALLGRYNLQQITTENPARPDDAAEVTLTRQQLIDQLAAGALTRAQVLRAVVQSREVDAVEFNGAFVAMQYYGYLRRSAEESGYQAWLNHLNTNPGDFRTMVNGFMNSEEYRLRFGQP